MTKQLTSALVSSASFLVAANAAAAQDRPGFTWEGSLEIGADTVFDSTLPGTEIRDIYAIGEIDGELALSDAVSIFGGLSWESMTDPVADRNFRDMGLYIREFGLQVSAGRASLRIGKVAPAFGSAWDDAAGFYSGSLAEDYELAEMIGGVADLALADGGRLSFGLFHADNTALSASAGYNRGRGTTASGGAGNTGKLNNAALQWSGGWGNTRAHVGLRYLSAGIGDVSDETGIVAGVGHSFDIPLDVFAEFAAFSGFGGAADDASYVTLNAAYAIGELTLSGTYARRDVTSAGITDLLSVGAEYEFKSGITLGGALAWVDDAGTEDRRVGLNVVLPLGG